MNNDMMTIQEIIMLKNQGKTPQEVMQMMYQRNPNYQQVEVQLKNMSQGKSPQEFVTQLVKQSRLPPEYVQAVNNIIGKK